MGEIWKNTYPESVCWRWAGKRRQRTKSILSPAQHKSEVFWTSASVWNKTLPDWRPRSANSCCLFLRRNTVLWFLRQALTWTSPTVRKQNWKFLKSCTYFQVFVGYRVHTLRSTATLTTDKGCSLRHQVVRFGTVCTQEECGMFTGRRIAAVVMPCCCTSKRDQITSSCLFLLSLPSLRRLWLARAARGSFVIGQITRVIM